MTPPPDSLVRSRRRRGLPCARSLECSPEPRADDLLLAKVSEDIGNPNSTMRSSEGERQPIGIHQRAHERARDPEHRGSLAGGEQLVDARHDDALATAQAEEQVDDRGSGLRVEVLGVAIDRHGDGVFLVRVIDNGP